jgi:hypothetical protein
MITRLLRPALLATLGLTLASSLSAQTAAAPTAPTAPKVTFPALSPTATLKQRIGLTDIELVYSRPSMKGRAIFGGIEAYGRVWRTGANNATRLTFSTPVKFQGTALEAGTYELFSIPNNDEWTVILQKAAKQWGAYAYDQKKDVARVTIKPIALPTAVETLTIDFGDIRDDSAMLNISWEKTRVPVKLEFDVAATLVPEIEAAAAFEGKKAPGFYYGAAGYYYEHNLDQKKALAWINEATAGNKPAFYMIHLKAKILAKLGDKPGAIAAANQSKTLAVAAEGPQSPFLKQNDDLIASLK